MHLSHKLFSNNVGVLRGAWGEKIALEHLRHKGYVIIDKNLCPVERDRRLEIDLIAWDRETAAIVFVEVKQHASLSPYARRLQSVNKRKLNNLRRAFNAWRRINKWQGSYRFDVIEIYGVPEGGQPIVDHIKNVRLFVHKERFVRWSE